VFREDYSTKQAGNAAENFSIITKISLNLLKNENSKKRSIKNKGYSVVGMKPSWLNCSCKKFRCVCPAIKTCPSHF